MPRVFRFEDGESWIMKKLPKSVTVDGERPAPGQIIRPGWLWDDWPTREGLEGCSYVVRKSGNRPVRNLYPAECWGCGKPVPARAGYVEKHNGVWKVTCRG